MHRSILRSTVALASGWIVTAGGYVLTVVAFSLFNPDTFTPGVPLPAGWLLITLFASALWSVAAGFVAGVMARRREIEHVVGLAIFALIVSVSFVHWNRNLAQVPAWYILAGEMLTSLALLAGGWLRRNQRLLLAQAPGGAPTPASARLSLTLRVERWRFWIAATVTFVTFLACFWALVLGAGQGVLW